MRQFLHEKLLRLVEHSSWDVSRVRSIPLAGEEPGTAPEETQDEESTVMVVEDSKPEETREKGTVMLADELRTVELAPAISPVGSCPVRPGRGFEIPDFARDVPSLLRRQMSSRDFGERNRLQKLGPIHEAVDCRTGRDWIPRPQARLARCDAAHGGRGVTSNPTEAPPVTSGLTDQAIMSVVRGLS